MSSTPRIGLFLLPPSATTDAVERAIWAEAQGYESVWLPDGGGKMHALTLSAALAVKTSTLRVGLGIIPVFTHTPALLASATTALAHLAPERIALGLGASSHIMMEGWHGIPFTKPLTRVRETVQVLRLMLAGEKVSFEGETLRTKGFKLNPPPPCAVPIHLAALRPKMLELAGEIADGVILHLAPLKAIPAMIAHVVAGARRAGRDPAEVEIVCRLNISVCADRAAGRDAFRDFALAYYSAPVYNRFLAWCGFEAEAEAIAEGFRQRDRAQTRQALSDAMVDELGVCGDADFCRERVRAFIGAGVQTVAINPFSPDPEEAERTMKAFSAASFS